MFSLRLNPGLSCSGYSVRRKFTTKSMNNTAVELWINAVGKGGGEKMDPILSTSNRIPTRGQ